MQKILDKVLKTTEAVEDYKILKENMSDIEFSISKPKAAYQYAEVRISNEKYR